MECGPHTQPLDEVGLPVDTFSGNERIISSCYKTMTASLAQVCHMVCHSSRTVLVFGKHYHYTNPGTPILPWSSIGEQQKPVRERERIAQTLAVFCMTNMSIPTGVHSFGDLPKRDM